MKPDAGLMALGLLVFVGSVATWDRQTLDRGGSLGRPCFSLLAFIFLDADSRSFCVQTFQVVII